MTQRVGGSGVDSAVGASLVEQADPTAEIEGGWTGEGLSKELTMPLLSGQTQEDAVEYPVDYPVPRESDQTQSGFATQSHQEGWLSSGLSCSDNLPSSDSDALAPIGEEPTPKADFSAAAIFDSLLESSHSPSSVGVWPLAPAEKQSCDKASDSSLDDPAILHKVGRSLELPSSYLSPSPLPSSADVRPVSKGEAARQELVCGGGGRSQTSRCHGHIVGGSVTHVEFSGEQKIFEQSSTILIEAPASLAEEEQREVKMNLSTVSNCSSSSDSESESPTLLEIVSGSQPVSNPNPLSDSLPLVDVAHMTASQSDSGGGVAVEDAHRHGGAEVELQSDITFLAECFPDLEKSYLRKLYYRCGECMEDAVSCALQSSLLPLSPRNSQSYAFTNDDDTSSTSSFSVSGISEELMQEVREV